MDMNNWYGWAMMQPLPIGDFKWLESKLYKQSKSFNFIYEVDLKYPQKLHDLPNDFPLPKIFTPPESKHKNLVPHISLWSNFPVFC